MSSASAASGAAAASTVARPSSYALADDEYLKWQRVMKAVKKSPDSGETLEAIQTLRSQAMAKEAKDAREQEKLLNWRHPVTGQTLLTELAEHGASEATLQSVEQLGCSAELTNKRGETARAVLMRKQQKLSAGPSSDIGMRSAPRSRRSQMQRNFRIDEAQELAEQQLLQMPMQTQSRALPQPAQRSSGYWPSFNGISSMFSGGGRGAMSAPPQAQTMPPMSAPVPRSTPMSTETMSRKRGKVLSCGEQSYVPKANINFDMSLAQEETLDRERLERSIQAAYGSNAKVQIDEVEDEFEAAPAAAASASGMVRKQKARCRVMFESVTEARTAQTRSMATNDIQAVVAREMALSGASVNFEGATAMDETDAITLKLDSDTSNILCGACLVYNEANEFEKVVCYSDRNFNNAVFHSGDTQVDGKSVHTIGVVQSKIPESVSSIYFTICSCAPHDLSGFKNPSIMLYSNSQPDANLLEYSIEQAANGMSGVIAKMLRRPTRSESETAVVAVSLRRKFRVPLLCLDLIFGMAAETSWDIEALGTSDWNIPEKICGSYHPVQRLIESKAPAPA